MIEVKLLTGMRILEDLVSVNDSVDHLRALHHGMRIVILVTMDLAKGRTAGIDMGRVVEHGCSKSALALPVGSIKEGCCSISFVSIRV